MSATEFDNRHISLQERGAHILNESKKFLHISLQIIEEDSSHTARLAAMFNEEVFVAPLLESRVVIRIVFVAGFLERKVKMARVFAKWVVWGQVGTAAEPARVAFF